MPRRGSPLPHASVVFLVGGLELKNTDETILDTYFLPRVVLRVSTMEEVADFS